MLIPTNKLKCLIPFYVCGLTFGECLKLTSDFIFTTKVQFILSLDFWSDSRAIRLEAVTPQKKQKKRERVCSVFFPSGLFSSLLSKWTGVWIWLLCTWCGGGDAEGEGEKKLKARQMLYYWILVGCLSSAGSLYWSTVHKNKWCDCGWMVYVWCCTFRFQWSQRIDLYVYV